MKNFILHPHLPPPIEQEPAFLPKPQVGTFATVILMYGTLSYLLLCFIIAKYLSNMLCVPSYMFIQGHTVERNMMLYNQRSPENQNQQDKCI